MIVTAEMKVKDALKINEHMLEAFAWLAPEFKRLRNPVLRKAIAGRVDVSQAARVGHVPLTEALYVLNLAAGEDEQRLARELELMPRQAFECRTENPPLKPRELLGMSDDDPRVRFVDVIPRYDREEDPRPLIMRGLMELRDSDEVLLVRHRYDPIPLRDLFAQRGFGSWAEERAAGDWYVYFYRPATAGAEALLPPPPAETYSLGMPV